MTKGTSIITIVCLCLIFGMGIKSYATPPISTANSKEQIMKRHIEKVKLKNPNKYQTMIQRAGGNITDCIDCHIEVSNVNLPPARDMDWIRQFKQFKK